MRLLKAYLVTAACMAVIGAVGLLSVEDHTPQTLTVIFYVSFFPSTAAGLVTYFGKDLEMVEVEK